MLWKWKGGEILKKKIIIVFLVTFVFSIVVPVFTGVAYAYDEGLSGWFDESFEGFDPDIYVDDDGKKLTWFEKSIARVLWTLLRAVMQTLHLEPLETVIFKRPMRTYGGKVAGGSYPPTFFKAYGEPPEVGGIFYAKEWENVVKPAHAFFKNISFAILVISVMIGGITIAFKSGNPTERAHTKEMFLNWIVTALLLAMMLPVMIMVFDVNTRLVVAIEGLVGDVYKNQGVMEDQSHKSDSSLPSFNPHAGGSFKIDTSGFSGNKASWRLVITKDVGGHGNSETFTGSGPGGFVWNGRLNGKMASPGVYECKLYMPNASGGWSPYGNTKKVTVLGADGKGGGSREILPTMRLTESLTTGSWFFTFLCFGGLILLTIYFNILYLLRKFIIMALLIIGPLIVLAWGRTRQMSLNLWMSELISNIFMQSAHAMVFALYLIITGTVTEGFMGSPFGKFLMLSMLIPVGMLLRQLITGWFGLLGIDEEMTAGRVFGGTLGSLASVGRMVGGFARGGVGVATGAAIGGPVGAMVGGASGASEVLGGMTGAAGAVGETLGAPGAGHAAGQIGSSVGGVVGAAAMGADQLRAQLNQDRENQDRYFVPGGGDDEERDGSVAGVMGGAAAIAGANHLYAGATQQDFVSSSEDDQVFFGNEDLGTIMSYDDDQVTIACADASTVTVPISAYSGDTSSLAVGQDVRLETSADDSGSAYVSGVTPVGFGMFRSSGSQEYGSIETGDGNSIYVDCTNCPEGELPADGQQVMFDYKFGDWLPEATNVRSNSSPEETG